MLDITADEYSQFEFDDANQKIHVCNLADMSQIGEITRIDFVQVGRHGGFRPDDQIRLGRLNALCDIALDDGFAVFRTPFEIERHVFLNE